MALLCVSDFAFAAVSDSAGASSVVAGVSCCRAASDCATIRRFLQQNPAKLRSFLCEMSGKTGLLYRNQQPCDALCGSPRQLTRRVTSSFRENHIAMRFSTSNGSSNRNTTALIKYDCILTPRSP
jgi:hypothetical protein